MFGAHIYGYLIHCQSESLISHWMIILVSPIMSPTEPNMANKFWAHNAISFEWDMSSWCSFLDPWITTNLSNILVFIQDEQPNQSCLPYKTCLNSQWLQFRCGWWSRGNWEESKHVWGGMSCDEELWVICRVDSFWENNNTERMCSRQLHIRFSRWIRSDFIVIFRHLPLAIVTYKDCKFEVKNWSWVAEIIKVKRKILYR